jgi:hypothetical protein
MNVDEELRAALRRKAPPDGFRERVMASVAAHTLPDTMPDRSVRRTWGALAAAAILIAMIGATAGRIIEGYRAKTQVLQAMHITREKLRDARDRVAERGTR